MTDKTKALEELELVEGKIEKIESLISLDVERTHPDDLLGVPWYQKALKQLEPLY